MAILRSLDGKFYEVPDETVSEYEMSEEQVKEMGGDQAEQQQAPDDGMQMPAGDQGGGGITVNLNFAPAGRGGAPMGENQEGGDDVQGHRWYYLYRNRYYAYRNRYWAYRNRY